PPQAAQIRELAARSGIIAIVSFAAIAVEVATAFPATAAAEIVRTNPTGAASTALAEMTTASPLAPAVTPRLAKNSRRRSTARLTRFCAASSLTPRATPPAKSDNDFLGSNGTRAPAKGRWQSRHVT